MFLCLELIRAQRVFLIIKERYLSLGEGQIQELIHTLTTEARYPINLTQSGEIFVLSWHYNGSKSSKDSKIKNYTQCLGYVSKDFTINDMKKKQD